MLRYFCVVGGISLYAAQVMGCSILKPVICIVLLLGLLEFSMWLDRQDMLLRKHLRQAKQEEVEKMMYLGEIRMEMNKAYKTGNPRKLTLEQGLKPKSCS